MRTTLLFRTLILSAGPLMFESATAQSAGDLDPTFGTGGTSFTLTATPNDRPTGLVIQPDQKIVMAGRALIDGGYYPMLVRLNTDGTHDESFSGDGITRSDVEYSTTYYADADALGLQDDGKLVCAFHNGMFGEGGMAATRFNSDGTIDTDFGDNGTATAIAMEQCISQTMIIQEDGKIIVCGSGTAYEDAPFTALAVRFTIDGDIDETFDGDGIFTYDMGQYGIQILDAKQDGNGKIVLVCQVQESGHSDTVVIRLNDDGSIDESFGGGTFIYNISGSYDTPKFVTVKDDNSLLIAGVSYFSGDMEMTLAHITSSGAFDDSFGTGGYVVTALGEDGDIAESVAVAADGKIILAGWHEDFYIYGAVLRYHPDGTIDETFGDGGKVYIDAYGYWVENVRLQADGNIIVIGRTSFDGVPGSVFTASRLLYTGGDAIVDTDHKGAAFSVFPNPAEDILSIKWNGTPQNAPIKIRITDVNGKVVIASASSSFSQTQIDISQLSPGVYSIFLEGEKNIESQLFVVKH